MRQGFEQTGAEGSWRGAEVFGLPISAPEVQEALMLYAYRESLEEGAEKAEINLSNPEGNDLAIQIAAGEMWVEGESSFASQYRHYVEAHPGESADFHNEAKLEELLAAIKGEKVTLH